MDKLAWARELRDWVRNELVPRKTQILTVRLSDLERSVLAEFSEGLTVGGIPRRFVDSVGSSRPSISERGPCR